MPTAILDSIPRTVAAEDVPHKKFTRAEFHRMLDAGLFEGQRFELIEGDLIDKMGQKPLHACAVSVMTVWLVQLFGAFVRCQLSMEAGDADRDRSEPEPDIVVLREPVAAFWNRHPRGSDTLLAVEVSDTTLAFDRGIKAPLYARAGVPEFWVVDLGGRAIFVHRDPWEGVYRNIQRFSEREFISLAGRETSAILVSDLLPPEGGVQ